MLQQLVDLGLARATGSRGNTTYDLAKRFAQTKRDLPRVQEIRESQPTLPEASASDLAPQAGVTRHAGALLPLLGQPRSVTELMELTGLSESQVRYALNRLIEAGAVAMRGAQGLKDTRYARGATTAGGMSPDSGAEADDE